MISNKSFKVFHKNSHSYRSFTIKNGLQQGTVNSPLLFNLFLLDLVHKTDNIISFADDIIIYHPDKTIENINANLQEEFDIIEKYTKDCNLKISNRFLAGGDYNVKHTIWGSRLISPKGRQLKLAIDSLHLNVFSTGEPTYWPTDINKTHDLIDFFIGKGLASTTPY